MKSEIILTWYGPFSARDLLKENTNIQQFKVPGVYIWIEKLPVKERLSYVGKATGNPNLISRQRNHYANTIGGRATIPKEFRDNDQAWVPNQYSGDTDVLLDYRKFVGLIYDAFQYVEKIHIYLAPLPQYSPEFLKVIELNLLYDLKPSGTIPGTKTPPKEKVKVQHKNAVWYSHSVREDINLRGANDVVVI